MDYIELGPVPTDEECEQLGPTYNRKRAFSECLAFKDQLRRQFPKPEGVPGRLGIKSSPHDFGTYLEVVAYFDDTNEASMDWAFGIENNIPEHWDEAAKKELGL